MNLFFSFSLADLVMEKTLKIEHLYELHIYIKILNIAS